MLFRAEGMQVATLGQGDVVHLQNVTIGDNLGLEIQVVGGLAPTDKIIVNPSLGLIDGEKVKVVQATPGYEPNSTSASAK